MEKIVIFIKFIVGKRESSTILHLVISVIEIEFGIIPCWMLEKFIINHNIHPANEY